MPKQKVLKKQRRADGWQNLVTGLGTGQDKRRASTTNYELHQPEFYEQLYVSGSIPGRIVDLVPDEATRKWVQWLEVDQKRTDEINRINARLDLRGAFNRAWKWGRAYGGGLVHIVTDTNDPASAIRRGEKVIGLRDLSRWDVRIMSTDIEYDFGSPNWGCPNLYYLNVQMGSKYKGYPIHWTRMIRFDGQLVPRRTYIRNNYWHDSVLNRLYNSIQNYETSNDAAAACLQDFNVDVYKMKDLAALVAAGKEDVVKRRIELIQFAKSVIRAMILDAENEDYENKGRSLEGVADLLKHQGNRLVADTDIPHTKLLGESPDGSNATGNSTNQLWYDFISSEQENYARPKLERLLDIIFEGNAPGYKWSPLRVLDEVEEADVRNKQSITDQNYINSGVLDPSEVAQSRFGGEGYTLETKLDKEARAAGLIAPGTAQFPPGGGSDDDGEPTPPAGGKTAPQGEVSDDTHPGKDGVEGNESGLEFNPTHEHIPAKTNKIEPFIGPTMSEPMRDPKTDPKIKGPGIPNKQRTFLPTRGTGIIAPSGYDMDKDKPGNATYQREEGGSVESKNAERMDPGLEGTMKEFAKGTLKSSSGKKVTDPKQAAAIGHSQERRGK